MSNKITNISEKRRDKRQKTGWTEKEIKAALVREREQYKSQNITENEPDNLVSGDMAKIHEEENNEKE